MELTILGSGGAVPAHGRHPSAQLLRIAETPCLIDCGEGTQFRLHRFKLPWSRIRYVFISHLHGDHVYGLAPLITSWHLTGRNLPLDIFGPPELEELLAGIFALTQCRPSFPLRWHAIPQGSTGLVLEEESFTVRALPLLHRITATGYLFSEKQRSGRHGPVSEVRYAYCSDTAPSEHLPGLIRGVDLLYHEATFLEEHADKAALTAHSTARQAAAVAVQAGVKRLLLGHVSARYRDTDRILEEASRLFPDTQIAWEGDTYVVHSNDLYSRTA